MNTKLSFTTIVGILFGIGCLLFACSALWLVGVNNTAVDLDEGVNSQWAQVGVALQRRADLYPTFEAIIVGAQTQELAVMAEYRDQAAALSGSLKYGPDGQALPPANEAEAQALAEALANYNKALANVMVYAADNPDTIKSLDLFENFQVEVEGTENRIATERGRYNKAVESARKYCRYFPNNLACGLFGFHVDDWVYFQPDSDVQQVPGLNFGAPTAKP